MQMNAKTNQEIRDEIIANLGSPHLPKIIDTLLEEFASQELPASTAPILCPKCNGQGRVLYPPYLADGVQQWSGTQTDYVCGVCNGAKLLYPVSPTPSPALEERSAEEKEKLMDEILQRNSAGGKVADKKYRQLFGHRKNLYRAMEEYANQFRNQPSAASLPVQSAGVWVKVDKPETLPPSCTVVNGYSHSWIDEDFNPEGIRECFLTDEGNWISAKWNAEQDCWDNDEHLIPSYWQQRCPPEKYVKCSDSLPKTKGFYLIKGLNNQGNPVSPDNNIIWFTGKRWTIREGCEVTEWLDKTPLPLLK